jgi:hypothetical protein
MKVFLFLAMLLTGVLSVEPVQAACGPPKCNVPDDPTPPVPPNPHKPITIIGYFEVASPDCTQEDYVRAIRGSQANALHLAQVQLRTPNVIQVTGYRYSTACKQSIYAGSFQGNSWIVQAFAEFRK